MEAPDGWGGLQFCHCRWFDLLGQRVTTPEDDEDGIHRIEWAFLPGSHPNGDHKNELFCATMKIVIDVSVLMSLWVFYVGRRVCESLCECGDRLFVNR